MDKKEALQILIQRTDLLTDKAKLELLGNLDKLSNEQIYTIGQFLALDEKVALEEAPETLQALDEIIDAAEKDIKDLEEANSPS